MPGKSGRDDEKSNASNTSENTSLNTKKKKPKQSSVWLREQGEIEYGQNTGVEDYKDSGKCFR